MSTSIASPLPPESSITKSGSALELLGSSHHGQNVYLTSLTSRPSGSTDVPSRYFAHHKNGNRPSSGGKYLSRPKTAEVRRSSMPSTSRLSFPLQRASIMHWHCDMRWR